MQDIASLIVATRLADPDMRAARALQPTVLNPAPHAPPARRAGRRSQSKLGREMGLGAYPEASSSPHTRE